MPALEMKVLTPVEPPERRRRARPGCARPPRSEPASGSVTAKAQSTLARAHRGKPAALLHFGARQVIG